MAQLINFWQNSSNILIDYANYQASVNETYNFNFSGNINIGTLSLTNVLDAQYINTGSGLLNNSGLLEFDTSINYDFSGSITIENLTVNGTFSAGIDINATLEQTSGILGINLGNANTWTAAQTFNAGNQFIYVDVGTDTYSQISFNANTSAPYTDTVNWYRNNGSGEAFGIYTNNGNGDIFHVYSDKQVSTANNTLDDGSGNMSIAGNMILAGRLTLTTAPIVNIAEYDNRGLNTNVSGGASYVIGGGTQCSTGNNGEISFRIMIVVNVAYTPSFKLATYSGDGTAYGSGTIGINSGTSAIPVWTMYDFSNNVGTGGYPIFLQGKISGLPAYQAYQFVLINQNSSAIEIYSINAVFTGA